MLERFTKNAAKAIVLAQEEARILGHNRVGTEQILLGLLAETEDLSAEALHEFGVTLESARIECEALIGRGKAQTVPELPFTTNAKTLLVKAAEESRRCGKVKIGGAHLLLGLLEIENCVGFELLLRLNVDLRRLKARLRKLLANPPAANPVESKLIFGLLPHQSALLAVLTTCVVIAPLQPMPTSVIGLGALLALLFYWPARINIGAAMRPTLESGDIAHLETLSVRLPNQITRGDLVAIKVPEWLPSSEKQMVSQFCDLRVGREAKPHLCRRVIAVPGDVINVINSEIYINGQHLHPKWKTSSRLIRNLQTMGDLAHDKNCDSAGGHSRSNEPIRVPTCMYFVLADCMSMGYSSTSFGFVPKDHITAKVLTIRKNANNKSASKLQPLKVEEAKHFEEIISKCSAVIALQPTAGAYAERAAAQRALGRLEECISDYSQAIRLSPKNASLYGERAAMCLKHGDYETAIADCRSLEDLDFDAHRRLHLLMESLAKTNRFDELLETGRNAEELGLADGTVLFWTAHSLLMQSRYPEALIYCDRALDFDFSAPHPHLYKSAILRRLNRNLEALDAANRAMQIASNSDEAHFFRSIVCINLQLYEDVEYHTATVLTKNPSSWAAHWLRGYMRFRKEEYDSALESVSKSIELHQNHRSPYELRCRILARLGQFQKAEADITRAFQLLPIDPACYLARGELRYRQANYEDALSDLNRAIEIDRWFKEAYQLRARVFEKLNRSEESKTDDEISRTLTS